MKKAIFGIIIALTLILSTVLPVTASPGSSVEISDFNIDLISGGVVGQETTVRISANIIADADAGVSDYKDMAVCQGMLKYWAIDSTWYLIEIDKVENVIRDYEYPSYGGDGAHANMSWEAFIDFTWTPYMSGDHYISARATGFANRTDGSWPPKWIFQYEQEYAYKVITIEEATLDGWENGDDFEVSIGDGFACYETYEFDGLILNESIDQECPIAGHTVGLHMTAGTMILGTGKILINYDGLELSIEIPTDAIFSQLVTITVDGVSVLTFSEINGGIPH